MQDRERNMIRVTLVGSLCNVLLTGLKFAAGLLGHSAALVADAVHSLSDFLTDLLVVVFVRLSARPQDADHAYGHGKFETLATLGIGLALGATALGVIWSGLRAVIAAVQGTPPPMPGRIALWVALVSIAVKELLYRYTARCGRKWDSSSLTANAWHHRSDALSSVGAALGVGGALLLGGKWTVLDPVAAILVGLMLCKVTVDLLRGSFQELTDSALPPETEEEIRGIICATPGVRDPHNLRTRRIGKEVAIEVHVRMDGSMSLRDAHARVTDIENRLHERFGPGAFVTIHMEPVKEGTEP